MDGHFILYFVSVVLGFVTTDGKDRVGVCLTGLTDVRLWIREMGNIYESDKLTHDKPVIYTTPFVLAVFRLDRRICKLSPESAYRCLAPDINKRLYVSASI